MARSIKRLFALFKRSDPRLVQASENGDLMAVRQLLAAGASPNSTDQDVYALTEAVRGGHTEIVEELLNAGASVHIRTQQHNMLTEPILYEAVCGRHWRIVELLVAAGAKGNADTVFEAALVPDIETLCLLLESGADPDWQSDWPEYELDLMRAGIDPDEAEYWAEQTREWMTGGSDEPFLARQYLGCPDEITDLLRDLIHDRKDRAEVIEALEALKPRFPRIEEPQPDEDLVPGPAPYWYEVNTDPDVIVTLAFDPGERPSSEIADAARLLAEDGVTGVLLYPAESVQPDEIQQLIAAIKRKMRRISVLVALEGSHTELIDLLDTCGLEWLRAGLSGLCLTVNGPGLDDEERAWFPLLADLSRELQVFNKRFRILIDGPNQCTGLRTAALATGCDAKLVDYSLTSAIDEAAQGDLAPLKNLLNGALLENSGTAFAGTTRILPPATPLHILIGVLGATAIVEIGDWLAGPHNDFTVPDPWTVDDVGRAANGLLLCRLRELADRATAPRILLNTESAEKTVFLKLDNGPAVASPTLAIAWIGGYGIDPVISAVRFDPTEDNRSFDLRFPSELPPSFPQRLRNLSNYPGRQFGMHFARFQPGDTRLFVNEMICDVVIPRAETFYGMIRDLMVANNDNWHRLLYRIYIWGHLADSWPRQEKWTEELRTALVMSQTDSNPETRRRLSWIWAQPELNGPVYTRVGNPDLLSLPASDRSVLKVFYDLPGGDEILRDYFNNPELTLDQATALQQLEVEANYADLGDRERAHRLVDAIRSEPAR